MKTDLPDGRLERLEWLEARIGRWKKNCTELGLSLEQLEEIEPDMAIAREAFHRMSQGDPSKKLQTYEFYEATAAAHHKALEFAEIIEATAKKMGDPVPIYRAAGFTTSVAIANNADARRLSIDEANVNKDGSVVLKLSGFCRVGTIWEVERCLDNEKTFRYVGGVNTHDMTFKDSNLPEDGLSAQYRVQSKRKGQMGAVSNSFVVTLREEAPPLEAGRMVA